MPKNKDADLMFLIDAKLRSSGRRDWQINLDRLFFAKKDAQANGLSLATLSSAVRMMLEDKKMLALIREVSPEFEAQLKEQVRQSVQKTR